MQKIWEIRKDWDEPLEPEIIAEWGDIKRDIYESSKLEIPRWSLQNIENENLNIHIFTDASLKAYGACAYLVYGERSTFIMAKNKVAPVKKLTIPKLELLAAVLGTRMLMHLKENIPFNNATLWSDSQIVLNWLNSDKILPAFINNRVTEIKDHISTL